MIAGMKPNPYDAPAGDHAVKRDKGPLARSKFSVRRIAILFFGLILIVALIGVVDQLIVWSVTK
jgi:hypothetical protein